VRPIVETATETKTEAEQKKKVATYYTRTPEQMAQAVQGTTPVAVTYAPAPVVPPEGYEVASVKTVVTGPKPPMTVQQALHPPAVEQVTVTTFKAKEPEEVATSLFGPKVSYYDPATGKITEELVTRKGELIYVTRKQATAAEVLSGRAVPSPQEQQAILGLSLASTAATGVAVPKLGAFALGGLGVAETAKVGITGKHLTVEEAVVAAGVSQLVGYGVMSLAPYAKTAYSKLVGKLSPERAMYQRVVLSQMESKAPVGTKSWTEKIMMKVSPERALYGRVVKETLPSTNKIKDVFFGSGGGKQWVQQQVLLKQAPIQKAPMKPFTIAKEPVFTLLQAPSAMQLTIPKTTQKTVTKTAQKTAKISVPQLYMTQTVQEQVVNPFLQFRGKPYFQKRKLRPEELLLPIVYPGQTPLATPSSIQSSIQKTFGFQATLAKEMQMQIPTQTFAQQQAPIQMQIPMQKQTQLEKQVETQIQKAQQTLIAEEAKTTQQLKKPTIPYFPLGGGEAGGPSYKRFFGAWFPRKHKVKTWEQQLRTFGLSSKMPKTLKISKKKPEQIFNVSKIVGAFGMPARKTRRKLRKKRQKK